MRSPESSLRMKSDARFGFGAEVLPRYSITCRAEAGVASTRVSRARTVTRTTVRIVPLRFRSGHQHRERETEGGQSSDLSRTVRHFPSVHNPRRHVQP